MGSGRNSVDFRRQNFVGCGIAKGMRSHASIGLEGSDIHHSNAFTRAELAERSFGHDYEALERTIDAHVMNLRRKVESDRAEPRVIVTAFGIGYRLGAPDGH